MIEANNDMKIDYLHTCDNRSTLDVESKFQSIRQSLHDCKALNDRPCLEKRVQSIRQILERSEFLVHNRPVLQKKFQSIRHLLDGSEFFKSDTGSNNSSGKENLFDKSNMHNSIISEMSISISELEKCFGSPEFDAAGEKCKEEMALTAMYSMFPSVDFKEDDFDMEMPSDDDILANLNKSALESIAKKFMDNKRALPGFKEGWQDQAPNECHQQMKNQIWSDSMEKVILKENISSSESQRKQRMEKWKGRQSFLTDHLFRLQSQRMMQCEQPNYSALKGQGQPNGLLMRLESERKLCFLQQEKNVMPNITGVSYLEDNNHQDKIPPSAFRLAKGESTNEQIQSDPAPQEQKLDYSTNNSRLSPILQCPASRRMQRYHDSMMGLVTPAVYKKIVPSPDSDNLTPSVNKCSPEIHNTQDSTAFTGVIAKTTSRRRYGAVNDTPKQRASQDDLYEEDNNGIELPCMTPKRKPHQGNRNSLPDQVPLEVSPTGSENGNIRGDHTSSRKIPRTRSLSRKQHTSRKVSQRSSRDSMSDDFGCNRVTSSANSRSKRAPKGGRHEKKLDEMDHFTSSSSKSSISRRAPRRFSGESIPDDINHVTPGRSFKSMKTTRTISDESMPAVRRTQNGKHSYSKIRCDNRPSMPKRSTSSYESREEDRKIRRSKRRQSVEMVSSIQKDNKMKHRLSLDSSLNGTNILERCNDYKNHRSNTPHRERDTSRRTKSSIGYKPRRQSIDVVSNEKEDFKTRTKRRHSIDSSIKGMRSSEKYSEQSSSRSGRSSSSNEQKSSISSSYSTKLRSSLDLPIAVEEMPVTPMRRVHRRKSIAATSRKEDTTNISPRMIIAEEKRRSRRSSMSCGASELHESEHGVRTSRKLRHVSSSKSSS